MDQVAELIWLAVIYVLGEIVIWGLSRVMAPVGIQFFASILGMAIVFIIMTGIHLWYPFCDEVYKQWVKSKVDFINIHMGVGFSIPIIMMGPNDLLEGHDIACVIGNFVITNLVSSVLVFLMSFLVMNTIMRARDRLAEKTNYCSLSQPPAASAPRIKLSLALEAVSADVERVEKRGKEDIGTETATPILSEKESMDNISHQRLSRAALWDHLTALYPAILSFFCALVIGAPIMATTGDSRLLDGFVLWFVWITVVKMQRLFKQSRLCFAYHRLKNAFATLMNPVLVTTLLMIGYTRAKAAAIAGSSLHHVLTDFSGGSPLYAILTSAVAQTDLPGNPDRHFGAGDAALSILEVGILVWGFKLYECRRQLRSVAGILTVVISVAAAAGNVFLCVVCGRLIGLKAPESLAFAARSTTLALSKPAIEAVGGNVVANAALVVSNGILGQLLYPYALGAMGVRREGHTEVKRSAPSQGTQSSSSEQTQAADEENRRAAKNDADDPTIIAAGISIGINGAAMGVAYLYETKSRAAPYAALAMAIFGVMTVVFTTVEPFKTVVVGLANL